MVILRHLQLIAAMTVACMYEDQEKRQELYIKMGALLNLFDDDFGRVASDLEDSEIAPVPPQKVHVLQQQEAIN